MGFLSGSVPATISLTMKVNKAARRRKNKIPDVKEVKMVVTAKIVTAVDPRVSLMMRKLKNKGTKTQFKTNLAIQDS